MIAATVLALLLVAQGPNLDEGRYPSPSRLTAPLAPPTVSYFGKHPRVITWRTHALEQSAVEGFRLMRAEISVEVTKTKSEVALTLDGHVEPGHDRDVVLRLHLIQGDTELLLLEPGLWSHDEGKNEKRVLRIKDPRDRDAWFAIASSTAPMTLVVDYDVRID